MRNSKKIFAAIAAASVVLAFSGCAGGSEIKEKSEKSAADVEEEWKKAATTPYGKYPEKVTYTLAQMNGASNSNLPSGDTYEDNEYTRYLKKMLNIQNENVYMEREDRYNEGVNVLVQDRNIPDVMVVDDRETLNYLVENDMIEDLSQVYESCATDRIKEMYDSYGPALLASGTYDGKLMALPETVIDHGPCFLWLRRDWINELGLEEPESLEDAFNSIEAFVENRMGTDEGEDPIGLICDNVFVGSTSANYSIDPIFDLFGAHPRKWQICSNGEIIYGSLTASTKKAISYIHNLYERGIIDKNFALREQNNLRDLVVEGKCGAFFGLWWTPNNPLMDEVMNNPDSDWEPYYLVQRDEDYGTDFYNSFSDNKYVVVRKGYEHPEIVMKIVSVLFDYSRYDADDADEVNGYFALNVDPTARPLVINVDYYDATYIATKDIRKAMNREITEDKLSALEESYYTACTNYLTNYMKGEAVNAEDWAAYKSRISAIGLLVDHGYEPPTIQYLAGSDGEVPQTLQNLEKNAFIQMVMGNQPMDYFETFVEEWLDQGGRELSRTIQQENQK